MPLQAPLFKLDALDAFHTPWDKHGVPVQIAIHSDISVGNAFFDFCNTKPAVDCFALFLDAANCLVLKKSDQMNERYERIGIAQFIRPSRIRDADFIPPVPSDEPLSLSPEELRERAVIIGPNDTWGPITADDPKTTVTII
jgi:hypothetical protein